MIDIEHFIRGNTAPVAKSPALRINNRTTAPKAPVVTPPKRGIGLKVQVLLTPYTQRSLPQIIGKTLEVLETRDTMSGRRYCVEICPGTQLWLPKDTVAVIYPDDAVGSLMQKPGQPVATSFQAKNSWDDPLSWR